MQGVPSSYTKQYYILNWHMLPNQNLCVHAYFSMYLMELMDMHGSHCSGSCPCLGVVNSKIQIAPDEIDILNFCAEITDQASSGS